MTRRASPTCPTGRRVVSAVRGGPSGVTNLARPASFKASCSSSTDERALGGRQPSRAWVLSWAVVPRRSANEMSLLSLPSRTSDVGPSRAQVLGHEVFMIIRKERKLMSIVKEIVRGSTHSYDSVSLWPATTTDQEQYHRAGCTLLIRGVRLPDLYLLVGSRTALWYCS
jgi:hypothetical protein